MQDMNACVKRERQAIILSNFGLKIQMIGVSARINRFKNGKDY